ncbi:hypothetical protein [Micromonospora echinaurantiaca]|uniref:hypothetical protein n=1 Tax=Micromonospora echinaurantiaca TaxID=47857 RepID=UPI001E4C0CA9|nr:hypothetical protein [Micromonospora echinaurantiaca]
MASAWQLAKQTGQWLRSEFRMRERLAEHQFPPHGWRLDSGSWRDQAGLSQAFTHLIQVGAGTTEVAGDFRDGQLFRVHPIEELDKLLLSKVRLGAGTDSPLPGRSRCGLDLSTPSPQPAVPPGVGPGLAMAVRAEEAQVGRAVVEEVAVDVVDVQGEWPALPPRPDAALFALLGHADGAEGPLQPAARNAPGPLR